MATSPNKVTTPYGPGTPAVAANGGGKILANPTSGAIEGSKKIDVLKRDYVHGSDGRIQGMTNAQQLVLMAVRTVKESSAMRSLGQGLGRLGRVTGNFDRRMDLELRAAVQHIVDANIIAVRGTRVQQVRPGVFLAHLEWRDVETGRDDETPVGR